MHACMHVWILSLWFQVSSMNFSSMRDILMVVMWTIINNIITEPSFELEASHYNGAQLLSNCSCSCSWRSWLSISNTGLYWSWLVSIYLICMYNITIGYHALNSFWCSMLIILLIQEPKWGDTRKNCHYVSSGIYMILSLEMNLAYVIQTITYEGWWFLENFWNYLLRFNHWHNLCNWHCASLFLSE